MDWEKTPLNIAASVGDNADPNLVIGLLVGFVLVSIVLIFLIVAEMCAYCEIYRKAGVAKCWKALIPVYRYYVLCQLCCSVSVFIVMLVVGICALLSYIVGLFIPWFFLVFGAALIVEFVVCIVLTYKVCKSFGHGFGWTIGFIFLHPIFLLMLAFGKSKYIGKK